MIPELNGDFLQWLPSRHCRACAPRWEHPTSSDEHLQGEVLLGASLPLAVLAAPAITRFLQNAPDVQVCIERQHHTAVARGVRESH